MNSKFMYVLLAGALTIPTLAFAEESAKAATQEVATLVEVGNTKCPVSLEKVGMMGPVVKQEYNGKIYNLCCVMCKKDFNKDPEKYSKIAEDEVKAAAENASEESAPMPEGK